MVHHKVRTLQGGGTTGLTGLGTPNGRVQKIPCFSMAIISLADTKGGDSGETRQAPMAVRHDPGGVLIVPSKSRLPHSCT